MGIKLNLKKSKLQWTSQTILKASPLLKFIISQAGLVTSVFLMTKIQIADRRKTGDKEIRKTKIEGISNSSSNVRKVMQINTQRSVLWGSGNQQLMKLTIRKQAKQIKV